MIKKTLFYFILKIKLSFNRVNFCIIFIGYLTQSGRQGGGSTYLMLSHQASRIEFNKYAANTYIEP